MKLHLVLLGCDGPMKASLESYWSKKLPRLEKLLAPYRPDLQDVRLTIHRHQQNPQRAWYEGRAVVHLPTGTLAAEANDEASRNEAVASLGQVEADVKTLELKKMLSGQNDRMNCFMDINAGAILDGVPVEQVKIGLRVEAYAVECGDGFAVPFWRAAR